MFRFDSRGKAAKDALRPESVTQSVTGGVPMQSAGTIGRWDYSAENFSTMAWV